MPSPGRPGSSASHIQFAITRPPAHTHTHQRMHPNPSTHTLTHTHTHTHTHTSLKAEKDALGSTWAKNNGLLARGPLDLARRHMATLKQKMYSATGPNLKCVLHEKWSHEHLTVCLLPCADPLPWAAEPCAFFFLLYIELRTHTVCSLPVALRFIHTCGTCERIESSFTDSYQCFKQQLMQTRLCMGCEQWSKSNWRQLCLPMAVDVVWWWLMVAWCLLIFIKTTLSRFRVFSQAVAFCLVCSWWFVDHGSFLSMADAGQYRIWVLNGWTKAVDGQPTATASMRCVCSEIVWG